MGTALMLIRRGKCEVVVGASRPSLCQTGAAALTSRWLAGRPMGAAALGLLVISFLASQRLHPTHTSVLEDPHIDK